MKILSTISVVLFLLFWELLSRFNFIDQTFFPSPTLILTHTLYLLQNGSLLSDTFFSVKRLGIASAFIIPLSVLLAHLSSRFNFFNLIFSPFVYLTYPLPKIALFPLILVLFGIDDVSKIVMISIGMFFPLFIQTRHSMIKLLNSDLYNLVRIYNISGSRFYFNFLLKGILTDFFIGLTNSINYGLTLVVVSETSAAKNGLGHGLWSSWEQFRIEDMYSYIFIISIIGFFFNNGFQKIIFTRKKLNLSF